MNTISLKFMGAFLLLLATAGCNRETVMPELERPARADTEEDLLKDSVYRYTYGFYLWKDDLPDWFADVRGHTKRYNSADAVLDALKGYARDGQGNPYDRFSFLDRWGTVNAEIKQGLAGSFGFDVFYLNDTDLYVKKVDAASPAQKGGIRRGWQIIAINGNSNLSLTAMERDNFTFLFDALDGSLISLVLRKPDGDETAVELERESYRLHPILATRVFDVAGKKVGYFAFDMFVSVFDDRGNPTYLKDELDLVMAQFETAGAQELIVDLRYNGGGAVVTAEYLSNLLAPAAVGRGLMYTNKVNDGLDAFLLNHRIRVDFSPVHFHKTNGLNLNRIYFLVTGSTASASELLINNLQPHIDVKLIGERTYGKPVGYFNWNILGVDLYAVSFQTFNSADYGDYFSGMPVDQAVFDDLTKDFGDEQEDMVAEALYYAQHGRFSSGSPSLRADASMREARPGFAPINEKLERRGRKGMFRFGGNVNPR